MVSGLTIDTTALALSTAQNATTVSTVLSPKTMTRSPRCDAALDQDVRQVVGAPIDGAERQAILGPDERDLVAEHARGVLDVVVQLGNGSVDVGHGWMRAGRPRGAAAAAT